MRLVTFREAVAMWLIRSNTWLCFGIVALPVAISSGKVVPYHKQDVEGPAASAPGMELVDPPRGKGKDA